jgi:60 kDa SS-A/Ro ribonucleoprotein
MANSKLFKSKTRGRVAPATDTRNKAGGLAYKASGPKAILAQLAATGFLRDTQHTKAEDQLKASITNLKKVGPRFIGQLAIYSRQRGYMKDMPAFLAAYLTTCGDEGRAVLRQIFPRVINNGKMVRNFVQILRSGQLGRKSLGSAPRKLVRDWLARSSDDYLFRASVGNDPSLADIIKMVHPKATTPQRNALYGYLIGRKFDSDNLPEIVQSFEAWKKGGGTGAVPKVDFRQLTSLPLTPAQWGQIAHDANWHMARMNLNTFARQGVFNIKGMDSVIAKKLADAETIKKAMVFPYQLLVAYQHAEGNVPHKVREGLQDAMELATNNIPRYGDGTAILVDNSGSMSGSITGYGAHRQTASKVTCKMVAGLIAASVVRTNKDGKVICFADSAWDKGFNPRDSIITNAQKFGSGGGGTNISAAFHMLNKTKHKGDLVILVSDMETWAESGCRYNDAYTRYGWGNRYGADGASGTGAQQEWNAYKVRNPNAKLVTIDVTANTGYKQFKDKGRSDILTIGGFNDTMWDVINDFALNQNGPEHWLRVIESIDLDVAPTSA